MGVDSRTLEGGFDEARSDLAISCLPPAVETVGAIARRNSSPIGLSPIQGTG
jgi:hypothetical protein